MIFRLLKGLLLVGVVVIILWMVLLVSLVDVIFCGDSLDRCVFCFGVVVVFLWLLIGVFNWWVRFW